MMLYIDMLAFCLLFDIVCKDNTGFIIVLKYVSIYWIRNS